MMSEHRPCHGRYALRTRVSEVLQRKIDVGLSQPFGDISESQRLKETVHVIRLVSQREFERAGRGASHRVVQLLQIFSQPILYFQKC